LAGAPPQIPAEGAYSAPQTPYLDLRGLLLRGGRGGEGRERERRGRNGKGAEEMYSSTTYF